MQFYSLEFVTLYSITGSVSIHEMRKSGIFSFRFLGYFSQVLLYQYMITTPMMLSCYSLGEETFHLA